MAEKIYNRYKVMSYLTKETLDALDEYRAPLGMSRSSAIGMMVNTFLIQQKLIDSSSSMTEMLQNTMQMLEFAKQYEEKS